MYIKRGDEYVRISVKYWLPCCILLVLLVSVGTFMIINPFGPTEFAKLRKFSEGVAMLKDYYYEEIDNETLLDGALLGMSASVKDPYTVYMDKEEAQSFMESVDSDDYAGVGLYIYKDEETGLVTVSEPLPDTPASRAGIGVGDTIKAVDGDAVNDESIDSVALKMKGEPGTKVVLTVIKADTNETVDIELIRENIERRTVTSEKITDTTTCIRITQFGVNTFAEFVETFNAAVENGMEHLVIDLRENHGGYLQEAIEIADVFMKDGLIVYTMNKDGEKTEYKATPNSTKAPIVILVNGESASASEVLVGALKDNNLATVVGEKTFGKGVTQVTLEFTDGSMMKITDSRYYTPSGICIDHKGIEPDVEVKMDPEKYSRLTELLPEEDEQMLKAVEILEKN